MGAQGEPKKPWSAVDYGDPGSNMFGFLPCPKCGGKYAAPFKNKETMVVEACCDDCGYAEGPVTGETF